MASPIAFLVGWWRGSGHGEFPTMDPFDYEEEIRFVDHGGTPLVYQQRAWSPDDGEPLHIETGIWRAAPDGRLVVTVALPRVTEISEGTVVNGRIALATTAVRRAEGGAGLVAVRRSYEHAGGEIHYEVGMATADVPEVTHHLRGTLRRVEAAAAPGDPRQSSVK